MPQFLHTCVSTTKDEAKMLGCSIEPSAAAMISRVVELAVRWHTEVPVLVIYPYPFPYPYPYAYPYAYPLP